MGLLRFRQLADPRNNMPMPIPDAHKRGFAYARGKITSPELPKGITFDDLIDGLLEDRNSTSLTQPRQQALEYVYEFTERIARFAANIDITDGFSEFSLPPVPSKVLVDMGIITNKNRIAEIDAREAARRRRQRGEPETHLDIKALDPVESRRVWRTYLGGYEPPILSSSKSHTVTNTKDASIEADVVAQYVTARHGDQAPELFFCGESYQVHGHTMLGGTWYRIDRSTHPDFEVSREILDQFPPLRSVEEPIPATNEEIATIAVLLEYSHP